MKHTTTNVATNHYGWMTAARRPNGYGCSILYNSATR